MHGQKLSYLVIGVAKECTLHPECTWSGVGVYFHWWVIWLSPWSGILVYTYDIWSVVGVYTPEGVVTEWLWSVHSKLECTLRQGKGRDVEQTSDPHILEQHPAKHIVTTECTYLQYLLLYNEKSQKAACSVEIIPFPTWGISILWSSRLRYLPRNYKNQSWLIIGIIGNIQHHSSDGISQDIPQPPITKLRLKITHLIFPSNFQGHGRGRCTQKVPSRAKTYLWCKVSMWKAVLKLVKQILHVNQWTTMRISEIAIEII